MVYCITKISLYSIQLNRSSLINYCYNLNTITTIIINVFCSQINDCSAVKVSKLGNRNVEPTDENDLLGAMPSFSDNISSSIDLQHRFVTHFMS